jgi:hypothetical protein
VILFVLAESTEIMRPERKTIPRCFTSCAKRVVVDR